MEDSATKPSNLHVVHRVQLHQEGVISALESALKQAKDGKYDGIVIAAWSVKEDLVDMWSSGGKSLSETVGVIERLKLNLLTRSGDF